MNLNENILIFNGTNKSVMSFFEMNGIPYKTLKNKNEETFYLVPKKNEKAIVTLLADMQMNEYIVSWSDRYTEKKYLDSDLSIGMGILISMMKEEEWMFFDGVNYYGFRK